MIFHQRCFYQKNILVSESLKTALRKHFCLLLSNCERFVAHLSFCGHFAVRHRDALLVTAVGHPCHDALLALTFRHPCLPSPSEKGGSKAKLLKISRKADRDAPCDLDWGFAPNPIYFFQRGFSTVCGGENSPQFFCLLLPHRR